MALVALVVVGAAHIWVDEVDTEERRLQSVEVAGVVPVVAAKTRLDQPRRQRRPIAILKCLLHRHPNQLTVEENLLCAGVSDRKDPQLFVLCL